MCPFIWKLKFSILFLSMNPLRTSKDISMILLGKYFQWNLTCSSSHFIFSIWECTSNWFNLTLYLLITIDLHCVCRFFVVEDHILSTTQGLVNRAYMDELWEMSVSKLAASLRTSAVRICWFLAVFLKTNF